MVAHANIKVILGYLESSRPAYMRPCLKKKSKQTAIYGKKSVPDILPDSEAPQRLAALWCQGAATLDPEVHGGADGRSNNGCIFPEV